jgi:hypothetical protein
MSTSLSHVLVFGGLSWDPAIKGILVVLVATVILFGSIYLIIATNTGARLGLLIALSAFFGFTTILTAYWWVSPPGNGPRGTDPSWHVQEIYYHQPDGGQGPARTHVLNDLPGPTDLPTAAQVISGHPELREQLIAKPENTSLSDIAGIDAVNKDGTHVNGADVLKQDYGLETTQGETVPLKEGDDRLHGWKVVNTSNAGDAASAVDASVVAQNIFADATMYKRLNAFEWNEEEQLADACPEAVSNPEEKASLVPKGWPCRVVYRIKDTFSLWHPPRYMVVQIQPVIAQPTVAGQAPPTPKVDQSQPVMSVVLLRDEGNVRAKPAYFFVICLSLFTVFTLMLHYRDKTLQQNLDEAEVERTSRNGDGGGERRATELETTGSR